MRKIFNKKLIIFFLVVLTTILLCSSIKTPKSVEFNTKSSTYLVPGTSTIPDYLLIRNLSYYGASGTYTILESFGKGSKIYSDASYTFNGVPYKYNNGEMIQLANQDASEVDTSLTFDVFRTSLVFILRDPVITTNPSWLSDWTKEDDTFTGNNNVIYDVYSREYAAGSTVNIGANVDTITDLNGGVNQVVLVKEKAKVNNHVFFNENFNDFDSIAIDNGFHSVVGTDTTITSGVIAGNSGLVFSDSSTEIAYVTKSFNQINGDFSYSFKAYVANDSDNTWLRFLVSEGVQSNFSSMANMLTESYLFRVGNEVQVQLRDHDQVVHIIASGISLNEWHTYRYDFDVTNKTITVYVDGERATGTNNGSTTSQLFRNLNKTKANRIYIGSSKNFNSNFTVDDVEISPKLGIGADTIVINGNTIHLSSDNTNYLIADASEVADAVVNINPTDDYYSHTIDRTSYPDRVLITIVNQKLEEFTFSVEFDPNIALSGFDIRGNADMVYGDVVDNYQAVHFVDDSNSDLVYLEKSFLPISTGVNYNYDFYLTEDTPLNNVLLKSYVTNGQMLNDYTSLSSVGVHSYLNPIGQTTNMGLKVVQGTTIDDTNIISKGTWHNLKYEINVLDNTYRILLDNTLVVNTYFDFYNAQTSLNNIVIGTDYAGTADYYVKNVSFTEMSGPPLNGIIIDNIVIPAFNKNVSTYTYYTDSKLTNSTEIELITNLFYGETISILKDVNDQSIAINILDNIGQTVSYTINYENPIERDVTKAQLQALYDSVVDTVQDNYTDVTFNILVAERTNANAILLDTSSATTDYALAYYNLEKAINGLLEYIEYTEHEVVSLEETGADSAKFVSDCVNSNNGTVYSQYTNYEVSLVSTISNSSNLNNTFNFNKVLQNGSKVYKNSNNTFTSIPYKFMNAENIVANNLIYHNASINLTTNQDIKLLLFKDWNSGPIVNDITIGNVDYSFTNTGEIATASDGTVYNVYISVEIPKSTILELSFDDLISNKITNKNNILAFIKSHNANNEHFFYEDFDDYANTDAYIKSWETLSACKKNGITSANQVSKNEIESGNGENYLKIMSPGELSMPITFKEFANLSEKIDFKYSIMVDSSSGITPANQKFLRTWLTKFPEDPFDGRGIGTGNNDKLYASGELYVNGQYLSYNQRNSSNTPKINGLTLDDDIKINYHVTYDMFNQKFRIIGVEKETVDGNGITVLESLCNNGSSCLPLTIDFTNYTTPHITSVNHAYFAGRGTSSSLERLYSVEINPIASGIIGDILIDGATSIGTDLYQDMTNAYLYKYDPSISNGLVVSTESGTLTGSTINVTHYPSVSSGNEMISAQIEASNSADNIDRNYVVYFEANENGEKERIMNLLEIAMGKLSFLYVPSTFDKLLLEIEDSKEALANHKIDYNDTKTVADELEAAIDGLVLLTDKELHYDGKATYDYIYDHDFDNSVIDITNYSSLTVNFSIHKRSSTTDYLYEGLVHEKFIVSDVPLPAGTIITFEDFKTETPEFYSYIVTQADYTSNKTRYSLDSFIKAGTSSEHFVSGYNYNSATRTMDAEYNFILDFIDTEDNRIPAGSHTLTFEVEIAGEVESSSDIIYYNVYNEQTEYILDFSYEKEIFYENEPITGTLEIIVNPIVVNNITVRDTTINNLFTAFKFSLYDKYNGYKYDLTKGMHIEDNGNIYPLDTDNTLRINYNTPLQSLTREIKIDTFLIDKILGEYNIKVDLIGAYYTVNDARVLKSGRFPLYVVKNQQCSIKAAISGSTGIIDREDNTQINYNTAFKCVNIDHDAIMTVKLYKKNLNLFSDFGYTLVDLRDYIVDFQREQYLDNENEYIIENVPYQNSTTLEGTFLKTAAFNSNIDPGTYKMEFTIRNGDVINSDNLFFYIK